MDDDPYGAGHLRRNTFGESVSDDDNISDSRSARFAGGSSQHRMAGPDRPGTGGVLHNQMSTPTLASQQRMNTAPDKPRWGQNISSNQAFSGPMSTEQEEIQSLKNELEKERQRKQNIETQYDTQINDL